VIPQSQRVKVFAGGFFLGCLIAGGIALFRAQTERDSKPAPLPTFAHASEEIALPLLPFPHGAPFKTWVSPDTSEIRWLVRDEAGSLWRVSRLGDDVQIYRADELQVDGNPGIEPPALRAGLEHNGYEILTFAPLQTIFTVAINPFEPNSIEKNVQLLVSREPYILHASPIPFGKDKLTRAEVNFH